MLPFFLLSSFSFFYFVPVGLKDGRFFVLLVRTGLEAVCRRLPALERRVSFAPSHNTHAQNGLRDIRRWGVHHIDFFAAFFHSSTHPIFRLLCTLEFSNRWRWRLIGSGLFCTRIGNISCWIRGRFIRDQGTLQSGPGNISHRVGEASVGIRGYFHSGSGNTFSRDGLEENNTIPRQRQHLDRNTKRRRMPGMENPLLTIPP